MKFGTLQDVSIDFSGDIKEFGQYQFAFDTARGKIKIQWKAKFATINGKPQRPVSSLRPSCLL